MSVVQLSLSGFPLAGCRKRPCSQVDQEPSATRLPKSLPAAGRPEAESYSPARPNKPVPCKTREGMSACQPSAGQGRKWAFEDTTERVIANLWELKPERYWTLVQWGAEPGECQYFLAHLPSPSRGKGGGRLHALASMHSYSTFFHVLSGSKSFIA